MIKHNEARMGVFGRQEECRAGRDHAYLHGRAGDPGGIPIVALRHE